ncbi:MAG: chitobiase/beta-hexosaminidase C-terminal domain-containing protein [Acetobacterium sp.]|uniref:chitobiase/beta-hexosaminidase C-terminal domain-containing protein n=1 Tax=Acetobacterium sp. TaxID=1872094 RepID=UPI003241FB7E
MNDEVRTSKTKKILIVGFCLALLLMIASGIAYAVIAGFIDLPFLKQKINQPTIESVENSDGTLAITVVNPNEFGTVYYTLDGSEPLTNSKLYETPFTINVSTTLKARVIDDRSNLSEIVTQQFTIVQKTVETPVAVTAVPEATTSNASIIPEEYQGTWYSIKAEGSYTFTGNSFTYKSSGGKETTGTISRIEPYNGTAAYVFYPNEVAHGFVVDPEKPGDNMIKIDGNAYALDGSDYFD